MPQTNAAPAPTSAPIKQFVAPIATKAPLRQPTSTPTVQPAVEPTKRPTATPVQRTQVVPTAAVAGESSSSSGVGALITLQNHDAS